jgi:hypothetical protein
MKQQSKFSSEQQQQQHAAEQQTGQQAAREFSSPEDLLRFDAAQTAVPAGVAQRLKKSIGPMPPPSPRPWWQRIFGGGE